MGTTTVHRTVAAAMLAFLAAALAVAACGAVSVGGGGDGGGGGGGGDDGQTGARIIVAPSGPLVTEENGGGNFPDEGVPRLRQCSDDLRGGASQELEVRMERELRSATDPRIVTLLEVCRGVAELNNGKLLEASRDLDAAEGRLGNLPEGLRKQLELLVLRAQMVAKGQLGQTGRAGGYLARATALAPEKTDQLRQELAAAAPASPTTASTTGTGGAGTTTTTPSAGTLSQLTVTTTPASTG
jgi:hypothetical protein